MTKTTVQCSLPGCTVMVERRPSEIKNHKHNYCCIEHRDEHARQIGGSRWKSVYNRRYAGPLLVKDGIVYGLSVGPVPKAEYETMKGKGLC